MGAIEHLAIVILGADAAREGLLLSAEAHWNQNEADWRFFLSKGTVFGIRDDDHLIATAALLPYTLDNAWIGMVLFAQNWRRRGLATKLLDACLDAARKQGLTTWLDATPAGATVYGPLGFTPTLELRRLRFAGSTSPATTKSKLTTNSRLDDLIARDRRAMGFDRSALLRELGGRSGSQMISHGSAMALIRGGRTASHIGPLFADDVGSAAALIETIAQSETGLILIDVVTEHDEFLKNLTNSGWTIERPFQRMRFGRAATRSAEPPLAVAGPEYG